MLSFQLEAIENTFSKVSLYSTYLFYIHFVGNLFSPLSQPIWILMTFPFVIQSLFFFRYKNQTSNDLLNREAGLASGGGLYSE